MKARAMRALLTAAAILVVAAVEKSSWLVLVGVVLAACLLWLAEGFDAARRQRDDPWRRTDGGDSYLQIAATVLYFQRAHLEVLLDPSNAARRRTWDDACTALLALKVSSEKKGDPS